MQIVDGDKSILVRSSAKLNLSLAIHGRRSDGFHEIETVMVKVAIYDTLRISPRIDERITLRVRHVDADSSVSIPAGPENLVIRAAEAMRHHAGIRFGADAVLEKRIPAEAGLAGGSGNAAAALAGLNRLWRIGLDDKTLGELAATLGSDVPFFLSSSTAAVARGRGERIEAIDFAGPLHFVVVKPAFGLSTAGVYATFAQRCTASAATALPLVKALTTGAPSDLSRHLRNDLQFAADLMAPDLKLVRKRLVDECRYGAMMTGSGSACFGLCGSAREAKASAARVRAARLGRVIATTTA
ncbi:MAG: 4-(cytidine 5'-diphospho)-2-C-methyl-D-erythritol kinase [Planctomycetaceae bacterium]|nr:4-(cytidine 5'-diphospho)-2-C-methyl-D-erythritol kinase [Planctomycetaceae bacterium]